MAACAKNSMFSEALSLFESLLKFPYLKPDSYTYPSVLKACGGLRRVDYGEKIHNHLMKTGFLSDVVIASSLIACMLKCGLFGSSVKLFDEMLREIWRVGIMSFLVIIKVGSAKRLWNILRE
ncbi:UNVERIFIED_CONTAM: Pentatricopeptide repeat-containing protein [Sesamum radiatum]|uniref:Pentatricopeptide repeat-containing protein n=1 Tax=Sesamum radiatum TaxID=300843 RepID=A0AAW2NBQ2_SESRA